MVGFLCSSGGGGSGGGSAACSAAWADTFWERQIRVTERETQRELCMPIIVKLQTAYSVVGWGGDITAITEQVFGLVYDRSVIQVQSQIVTVTHIVMFEVTVEWEELKRISPVDCHLASWLTYLKLLMLVLVLWETLFTEKHTKTHMACEVYAWLFLCLFL